jgi:hypothetical protein
MALEGELGRAGIVSTADETVVTRDLRVNEDFTCEKDANISGDLTVDGDLYLSGGITGSVEGVETLYGSFSLAAAAPSTGVFFMVTPTGYSGYVSKVRTVVSGDPGAAIVLELNVGGTPVPAAYDVSIANGAAAGEVDASADIPSTETTAAVSAGTALSFDHDTGTSINTITIFVAVEITRT